MKAEVPHFFLLFEKETLPETVQNRQTHWLLQSLLFVIKSVWE